eukprot:6779109-Prorocentrum_lima.AAC.1
MPTRIRWPRAGVNSRAVVGGVEGGRMLRRYHICNAAQHGRKCGVAFQRECCDVTTSTMLCHVAG